MNDEWQITEEPASMSIGQALAIILLSPIVLAWAADQFGVDLVGILFRALGVAL